MSTESRYTPVQAAWMHTTEAVVRERLGSRVVDEMKVQAHRRPPQVDRIVQYHGWVPGEDQRSEHHVLYEYNDDTRRWRAKIVGRRDL